MCGIAGTYSYNSREPVRKPLLEKMTESLAHRGPDGFGYFLSDDHTLGFGHRRLSIIDLSTGDQPMCNEDGTVWITFNGEIYNYRELRDQLKKRGHRFKTASDTEVIIHAYEEWGPDCAVKFNGIFAFGIWDERRRQLFLARDHFGVKPLYYHDNGNCIHFASELKAILCDTRVPRTFDRDALHLCLTFRHTPSPWTLFKSIRKLPPSHYMVVNDHGVSTTCYWANAPEINRHKNEQEWLEELAAVYPEAIKRQMVSDAPIGLSLSGGVDSNTILALMTKHQRHVHTFTVGFDGAPDTDEISAAQEASKIFEADFVFDRVSEQDYMDFMSSYLWHLEEPIGNESAAAYYFVAKLAQSKVKVLLSGQGADEPFAGYPRHLAAQYSQYLQWIPAGLVRVVGGLIVPLFRNNESPGRFVDHLAEEDEVHQFLSTYSITTPAMRTRLFNPDLLVRSSSQLPAEYIRGQLARAPLGTRLEKMTYVDARTSLSDNLLLCGDKMAMAASIEMRVPFLDLELMKIAETIPGSFKVRDFNNKVIHKKVCERWLPESVVHRKKIGFNEAMGIWFRRNLDPLLAELTTAPDSITRTMLNPDYVRVLREEHNSGRQDNSRLLFLILSIEAWRKVFA